MKSYKNKKARQLELLFKEYYPMLCLISCSIVKDHELAKDIVQDFFVSYWSKKKKLLHTVSFSAYAVRAVKNLSFLALKNAKKKKMFIQCLNQPNSEEQKSFEKSTSKSGVQELISQLPESRRNIFMASVVHGQSYSEIAEDNEISVNTVKTQIKRAYAFLRSKADKDMLYLFLLFRACFEITVVL